MFVIRVLCGCLAVNHDGDAWAWCCCCSSGGGGSVTRSEYFGRAADTGGGLRFVCSCGVALRLMLHHDAKTAPAVRIDGGGKASAVVANAWPLPAGPLDVGGSCPGVTDACRDCYAAGIESWAPGYRRGAAANLDALHHLYGCGGVALVGRALTDVVRFSADAQRARTVARPVFRWHSGGDVFADWYGRAIVRAVNATPDVEHWTYTRTLSAVGILAKARGLRVYVSADRENVDRAARVAARHGVPLAMLAGDEAAAAALWGRVVLAAPGALAERGRPVVCPVAKWSNDGHGVAGHVVGPDGRRASVRPSSAGVGACVACGVCLPSAPGRPVTFLVHGGRAKPGAPGRLGAAVSVRVKRGAVAVTA